MIPRSAILKLLAAIISAFTFSGCNSDNVEDQPRIVSSDQHQAESVFLTKDNEQRPVICWVERDTIANRHHFLYAVMNDGEASEKINIPIPNEISTHAEGMPKLAFKNDGTVIAAYEQSTPTPENKWAGAIYYLYSTDEGKTWSTPRFLHSDTISGRSRGFFDLATLPDGEVGAAWLDIKSNQKEKGRTIRFAKTSGKSFVNEITLEEYACECCRIDLYTDGSAVAVAYRSVRKGNFNQTIRDMMFTTSVDNGATFSTPSAISSDKWVVDKCPHSGPSLASNSHGLHSVWYTEGNGAGVYFSNLQNGAFGPRTLVGNEARFPQIAAGTNSLFVTWVEQKESGSVIRYEKRFADGTVTKESGAEIISGIYPVTVNTGGDDYLLAYLGIDHDQPKVFYTTH